jgi:hypothetical protein
MCIYTLEGETSYKLNSCKDGQDIMYNLPLAVLNLRVLQPELVN